MKNHLKRESWTVYMLRNEKNALYTGITKDLDRRVNEHKTRHANCAKFTRSCKALDLVYYCNIGEKGRALTVEAKIKRLKKDKKEIIVQAEFDRNALYAFLGLPFIKGEQT